jgi:hypothetical protein
MSQYTEEEVPASQRLTFDMAAIASLAGLTDSFGNLPIDTIVPLQTSPGTANISREEVRFLLYVDGRASLRRIAEDLELPLSETIAIFLGLFRTGIVSISSAE